MIASPAHWRWGQMFVLFHFWGCDALSSFPLLILFCDGGRVGPLHIGISCRNAGIVGSFSSYVAVKASGYPLRSSHTASGLVPIAPPVLTPIMMSAGTCPGPGGYFSQGRPTIHVIWFHYEEGHSLPHIRFTYGTWGLFFYHSTHILNTLVSFFADTSALLLALMHCVLIYTHTLVLILGPTHIIYIHTHILP